MSACLTGCHKAVDMDASLDFCADCAKAWLESPEWRRSDEQVRLDIGGDSVVERAIMDFANRVRAERRPA